MKWWRCFSNITRVVESIFPGVFSATASRTGHRFSINTSTPPRWRCWKTYRSCLRLNTNYGEGLAFQINCERRRSYRSVGWNICRCATICTEDLALEARVRDSEQTDQILSSLLRCEVKRDSRHRKESWGDYLNQVLGCLGVHACMMQRRWNRPLYCWAVIFFSSCVSDMHWTPLEMW